MGEISYLGAVPSDMHSLERIMFMQDMGKLWQTWPHGMNEYDKWRWGMSLSHHKAANRRGVLTQALYDVCLYERNIYDAKEEVYGPKWQSIISHVLEHARFVCTKEGQN